MREYRNIGEEDIWAETIGKHCYSPRPLSQRVRIESTLYLDRLWKKLWKVEKNKPIQL